MLNTPGQPVHVFDRDVWTNITAGIVLPTDNATVNLNRTDVDISNDGRRVAFLSSRSLDPRDTNATNDVYIFEMPAGPVRLGPRTVLERELETRLHRHPNSAQMADSSCSEAAHRT